MDDLSGVVGSLYREFYPRRGCGQAASYIPALAGVSVEQFGVAVQPVGGEVIAFGDARVGFTIQSISKLFAFVLAFRGRGEALWHRVSKEPSGMSFNSLTQIEAHQGIPSNPFINAGAMVVVDMLLSDYVDPLDEVCSFIGALVGIGTVGYDEEVYRSEQEFGNRNAALCYLMKSFGNIENEVSRVLSLYFKLCSIRLCCVELAQAVQFLAGQGVNPLSGERVLSESQTKRTNALLLTSGMYNEAGDFAFRVGMPAKSGVGGGIVGLIPGSLTIVTWSPGLNAIGNPMLGMDFMEAFTTRTGLSIF